MMITIQHPHSQPLRGSLMWRVRGASRLARPGKENRFWSERKRPDLQDGLFPGVLNSYKLCKKPASRQASLSFRFVH
jgi:hypothetical protein